MPSIRPRFASLTCVLQVEVPKEHLTSEEENCPTQSCSGFIIDAKEGYIITTGGLFSEVLSTSDLSSSSLVGHERPDYTIKVFWEDHAHEATSELKTCQGFLVGAWSCGSFAETLKKIFSKSDGWGFKGEIPEDEEKVLADGIVRIAKTKAENPDEDVAWLSSFALIKADGLTRRETCSFSVLSTVELLPGSPVAISGTPFGSLFPSAFANSYAGGVITNLTGRDNVVVLTDARCLPGTEGAALFNEPNQSRKPEVIGLVVAPMCWKTNQWIGLSVVCSLHEILLTMFQQLPDTRHYLPELNVQIMNAIALPTSKCHNFMDSIGLVKVGPSWGSGVMVSFRKKLLLTCRHVVVDAINNNHTVIVRIDRETNSWCRAKVIFATSQESVIDLAIIQLIGRNSNNHPLSEVPISSETFEGESLFAVGFPLFGPDTHLGASVTSGHVSKVIRFKGHPIMLQTSCGVHPGSSGGALLSQRTGHLVGIMANNCRDDTNGVTIPHLNFGIPSDVFLKPLKRYLQSGDLKHLQAMNIHDSRVEALWNLQNSTNKEPARVTCKL